MPHLSAVVGPAFNHSIRRQRRLWDNCDDTVRPKEQRTIPFFFGVEFQANRTNSWLGHAATAKTIKTC